MWSGTPPDQYQEVHKHFMITHKLWWGSNTNFSSCGYFGLLWHHLGVRRETTTPHSTLCGIQQSPLLCYGSLGTPKTLLLLKDHSNPSGFPKTEPQKTPNLPIKITFSFRLHILNMSPFLWFKFFLDYHGLFTFPNTTSIEKIRAL